MERTASRHLLSALLLPDWPFLSISALRSYNWRRPFEKGKACKFLAFSHATCNKTAVENQREFS
jgi:hypothetical protein